MNIKILVTNKSRKFLYKLILLVFGLIGALILLEFLFAIFMPQETFKKRFQKTNRCFEKSPIMPVKFKSNCSYTLQTDDFTQEININSQGFRGGQVTIPKDNNTYRIIMTGDSFVFGNGVGDDETVPKLLEDILNQRKIISDKKVEIINAGSIGGGSPDGHLIALRDFISKGYAPDMIIMGLFIYNDLSDMDGNEWIGASDFSTPTKVKYKRFEITEEGMLLNTESEFKGIYKNKILRSSNLAIFFSKNFPIFIDKIRNKLGRKPYLPESNDPSDSNFYGIQFDDCVFGGSLCHRRFEHLFNDLINVFKAANQLVPKNGPVSPRFLVLLESVDFQIYGDAAKKYDTGGLSWGISNAYQTEDPYPQKRIKNMLDAHNIAYLDLLPFFRDNPDPRKYYVNDGHWNSLGTKLAAKEIADWIEDHK